MVNAMEEQFMADLHILAMSESNASNVTIRGIIISFRKKALKIPPDKSNGETTAEFQALGNAYQRALEYLVNKQKKGAQEENDDTKDDVETFTRDNFDLFNFPKKNTDSFTVIVENDLADIWQECFENLFGKPIVNKNKTSGIEAGRLNLSMVINNVS